MPWGKHTAAQFKYTHSAPLNDNITKDDVLPVVTVRNPYDWMVSMCKLPYTAQWARREKRVAGEICPHLVSIDGKKTPVKVTVKLAEQFLEFDSLAHLWNDWYAQYWRDADYPASAVPTACLQYHFFTDGTNSHPIIIRCKVYHCAI